MAQFQLLSYGLAAIYILGGSALLLSAAYRMGKRAGESQSTLLNLLRDECHTLSYESLQFERAIAEIREEAQAVRNQVQYLTNQFGRWQTGEDQ